MKTLVLAIIIIIVNVLYNWSKVTERKIILSEIIVSRKHFFHKTLGDSYIFILVDI